MTKAATDRKLPLLGAIWAQTAQGVIGRDGRMPWRVPEDLKHFKEVTAGKPVIMGRKTWESLPASRRPLPERTSIIVSRSVSEVMQRDGATWVPNLDVALQEAYKAHQSPVSPAGGDRHALVDAWIIGGGALYAEALSRDDLPHYGRASIAEVTFLAPTSLKDVPGDTKAPVLNLDDWKIDTNQLPGMSEHGYLLDEHGGKHQAVYQFVTYTRK